MSSKPIILIVGASIAGLSAATGLMQIGLCQVIVFERSTETETGRLPRNGGGIGLHEESARILNLLGVTTEYALPMRIHEDRDRTGRIIRKGMIPFYSAFWGDVHRCLLKSAITAGADVRYNKNVTSMKETEYGVSLGFSDGSHSCEGVCVIGADGILSTIRSLMFSDSLLSETDLVRHAGYYAWRGLVPLEDLPPGTDLIYRRGTFTIEISEKSHAILYYMPRGLNWLVYVNTNSEAKSTYHRSSDIAGQITRSATKTELDELYRTVEALYQPALVDLIKASESPLPFTNQMYDRNLITTYSTNRFVLIGDSAHSTTPHHIRGTNMAISDGFTLAKEFASAFSSKSNVKDYNCLKEIFFRYEQQQLKHCNEIVRLSAQIGHVRQGVFSSKQGPVWDTICQADELTELLGDAKYFIPID